MKIPGLGIFGAKWSAPKASLPLFQELWDQPEPIGLLLSKRHCLALPPLIANSLVMCELTREEHSEIALARARGQMAGANSPETEAILDRNRQYGRTYFEKLGELNLLRGGSAQYFGKDAVIISAAVYNAMALLTSPASGDLKPNPGYYGLFFRPSRAVACSSGENRQATVFFSEATGTDAPSSAVEHQTDTFFFISHREVSYLFDFSVRLGGTARGSCSLDTMIWEHHRIELKAKRDPARNLAVHAFFEDIGNKLRYSPKGPDPKKLHAYLVSELNYKDMASTWGPFPDFDPHSTTDLLDFFRWSFERGELFLAARVLGTWLEPRQ